MNISVPRRPLGDTGIEVSVLGLGTVKLGREQGLKYPLPFTIPDDADASRLLAMARELGINLLDTAPAYGHAEQRLGTLLRGQRQDWVIVTKTGEGFENGVSSFDFSPEHTRASVMRSLARLDTDWLDCVLVHSSGDDLGILREQGALDVLQDLKDEGVIRTYGISTKTLAGGLTALAHCDVVMLTLNMDRAEELPVVAAAHRRGRGILVKKAAVVGTIDPEHLRANAEAVAVRRL
jgi:aryl-alcohol dehydrogenase-like predicted oxidoreductase